MCEIKPGVIFGMRDDPSRRTPRSENGILAFSHHDK